MAGNKLAEAIENSPQDLLVPDESIKLEALKTVQESFNPIANQYSIFDQFHIDGLDAEQVWTQAQMVVDGVVDKLLGDEIPKLRPAGSKRSAEEMESDNNEEIEDEESEGEFDFPEGLEGGEEEDEEDENMYEDDYDRLEDKEDSAEDKGDDDDDDDDEKEDTAHPAKTSELDDDVFRLEDFQKQVMDLENNNGNLDGDDEEFDYFGDVPEDEEESDPEGGYSYADFFDPPKKQKQGSSKKDKKRVRWEEDEEPEGTETGLDFNSSDKDIMEAMELMKKKDMFGESEDEEEEDERGLSRHEIESKEITEQIKQLEQENVAEKSWAVKGEAKARDRPENSLLETELDFERSSKPVPVVTQEFNDSIEEIIKRRIMTNDFDDLPRRLPDTLPEFKQSRNVEVQETKSQKSLAELYEEDYDKQNDPEYKSVESKKLESAHKEITDLYNSVAFKLDALCSWNYTPKAPKPTISIVSDTPTISMEDAQPTTASGGSMLAPQEVYQPEASGKREVIGKDGLPVAKSEMSREERKRLRRREKNKRAKTLKEKEETEKSKAQRSGSKADVSQTLKKGNVTVIGKHGEKRDVSGKLKKEKPKTTGSNLKL